MYRSYTDRILGGVCGGIAPQLRLSPWILRLIFVIFAPLSLGVGAVIYVALWWILPQESLIEPRSGSPGRTLLAVIVIFSMAGVWAADLLGALAGPDEGAIQWPVVLLILGAVFLLRQVRG